MALSRARSSMSAILMHRKQKDNNTNAEHNKKEEQQDPIKKERLDHIQRIEKACSGTIKSAGIYYETNRKINLIIVTVGIVLLGNSIGYTWYKQTPDAWSLFSGGLGITSFATLFFTKPQQNITKALGNLAQIQMIYRSYCLQFDTILDAHIRNETSVTNSNTAYIEELAKLNTALQNTTQNAVTLIQEKVETEEIKTRTNVALEDAPSGSNKATSAVAEKTITTTTES
jgi:hypothetical protein